MPSALRILERLPSLYRPEPEDTDLYSTLIRTVGTALDEVSALSSEVLQSHWFNHADSALLSSFVLRTGQIEGSAPLRSSDPQVQQFPYLSDLPRLATLFDEAPWREPLSARERVEDFRARLARLVALYRNGLGTLAALKSIALLMLPPLDRNAPAGLRERPFTVEEFSPTRTVLEAVRARGQPLDLVGPLMRWQLTGGRFSIPMTAIMQGVTPVAGAVDATLQPALERFDPVTGTGIGIAYEGALAPGQALAIAPAFSSWLGTNTGLLRATSLPGEQPANPTAPGPWVDVPGTPEGNVVAQVQSSDAHVWLAVNAAGSGALWRSNGTQFIPMLTELPEIRCLQADGASLLVGFATGIARLALYGAELAFADDPALLTDPAVNAIARDNTGTYWLATDTGAARLRADDAFEFVGLGTAADNTTPLSAVFVDDDGTLFFGGELGLFRHRRDSNSWHFYAGAAVSEGTPDWQLFEPARGLPPSDAIFLPPVRCLMRGSDAALWLGTDQGIARYSARERRRTFTTLLEAFPHITTAAVRQAVLDERGRSWFASETGLLSFDGLDWYQSIAGKLTRLGRELAALPDAEGTQLRFWRFDRARSVWQRLTPGDAAGFRDIEPAELAQPQPAVLSILWTDAALALLGSFDGAAFTADPDATPAALRTRFKPDALRILDGGIATLPRLVPGVNHFRYLQLETATDPVPVSRPAWTREGRLLPEPSQRPAPLEARYLATGVSEALERVYAFNPAAKVWLTWQPREVLSVTVRLGLAANEDGIDAAILDRLFAALNHVRPAGVRVALAAGERIVRGT
jgi:hypothetical protein